MLQSHLLAVREVAIFGLLLPVVYAEEQRIVHYLQRHEEVAVGANLVHKRLLPSLAQTHLESIYIYAYMDI